MPRVLPRSSEPFSDFFSPLAVVHADIGLRKLPAEGEHQTDGQLGDGDGVRAWGVHDDHAAAGGGVGVDIVYSDSGAADYADFGCRLQQRIIDLHRRTNDKRVGVG